MSLKSLVRTIVLKVIYGARSTPESYAAYLKGQGISIGKGTTFYDPINTIVDIQNPKLITIGENVRITAGCKLLTHDYSWSVISGVYGECLGATGTIEIGNNVFIGVGTVVLRNTTIGDNVIVGAGSVVSGRVESNSVYAGNPARKIMSLEEFYEKRRSRVAGDIKNVLSHIDQNDPKEVERYLREYSCHFEEASQEAKEQLMMDTGYYDICKQYYQEHRATYMSVNEQIDKERGML